MHDGGALFTTSYYGAEKVIEHYNVMGPVKATWEAAVRYLAYDMSWARRDSHACHLAGPAL
jgi:enoyl-[acyl-carrier protein] reductase I